MEFMKLFHMISDIESLFKLFDRNNDGLITKKDLRLVLSEFGNPGEEEIQTIYRQMGVKQSNTRI